MGSKRKREGEFDIAPTGGGLRVKRWLRRVHYRGVEGATLYVGERVPPTTAQKEMYPERKLGFYISTMPYETAECDKASTFKKAIRKAKRRLLAYVAAKLLGAEAISP